MNINLRQDSYWGGLTLAPPLQQQQQQQPSKLTRQQKRLKYLENRKRKIEKLLNLKKNFQTAATTFPNTKEPNFCDFESNSYQPVYNKNFSKKGKFSGKRYYVYEASDSNAGSTGNKTKMLQNVFPLPGLTCEDGVNNSYENVLNDDFIPLSSSSTSSVKLKKSKYFRKNVNESHLDFLNKNKKVKIYAPSDNNSKSRKHRKFNKKYDKSRNDADTKDDFNDDVAIYVDDNAGDYSDDCDVVCIADDDDDDKDDDEDNISKNDVNHDNEGRFNSETLENLKEKSKKILNFKKKPIPNNLTKTWRTGNSRRNWHNKALKLLKKLRKENRYIIFMIKSKPFYLLERLKACSKKYQRIAGPPNEVAKLGFSKDSSLSVKISENFQNVARFWADLINNEENGPVLIMCGGKNSGKSTMARYLLNCALNDSSFAGFVNPSLDPLHYVRCLKLVHSSYLKHFVNLPLIVNTMGWNQGLGLSLFVETLKLVKPAMLVQLDGPCFKANFPLMLPKIINNESNYFYDLNVVSSDDMLSPSRGVISYSLHCLKSEFSSLKNVNSTSSRSSLTAADTRNLTLFANFLNFDLILKSSNYSNCTNNNHHYCNLPIYKVSLDSLALHVCHEQVPNSLILRAFNGRFCSLCVIVKSKMKGCPNFLKDLPVCQSKGIGIVYSIDMKSRCVSIATNVPADSLELVNCLLVGAVDLPKEMFDQDFNGRSIGVPYLDYQSEITGGGCLTPKGRKVPRLRPTK
ncbi:hypothetical protein HELRODRAFT_183997 [Helobdella robusta]|uniref:Uncharacterized protein n=1 Tax=Helobdella robusta TaxID=6412 RepID=T1FKE4_HELRO|nr:hypothetical protein HELRODRAFT_183997 [Helobdella robusta]ESO09635.1 hypothetical protein HELRODRAFT_183997 [Helobdella robusta]